MTDDKKKVEKKEHKEGKEYKKWGVPLVGRG
jgi:hypothetical protein